MSIDRISISNGSIDRALQSNGPDGARSSGQSHGKHAVNDEVSLSSAAKDADRLSNLVHESRAERLNSVREAIANGTYKVSSGDIAKKLVELNTR